MWRVVEILQSRATCGLEQNSLGAPEMTTVEEESLETLLTSSCNRGEGRSFFLPCTVKNHRVPAKQLTPQSRQSLKEGSKLKPKFSSCESFLTLTPSASAPLRQDATKSRSNSSASLNSLDFDEVMLRATD